ncbi:MAG: serine/threonine protein kinase [Bryobacterales bacterium]|nr:serine/threonine protein kinase [Bryobacterales bacterium]
MLGKIDFIPPGKVMTQEQWQQVWSLIGELRDVTVSEREAILQSGQVDPDVVHHVRSVLACEEVTEPEDAVEASEQSFGPYRPLRLLGEGAMGSVYLAEQDKPLKRYVALKIIRPGVRSREVLERFEIERRALAMMDHPNIARVLDAGQTPRGTPYFAMEYVAGVEVTRYCEQQQLPLVGKLQLLISVCQAIQHAHQKGIVHRDIKPSNVLVSQQDGAPVPKIIDFGIARAVGDAGLNTLSTNFGSFVGTIAYMSPEQAAHDTSALDTRSDVYSLGVLAYELVTGSTPLRDTAIRTSYANLPTLLQRIREETPEPLSRRAPDLDKELARELDWIVQKALEKDPARRYASAQSLAEDLRRYLEGEPVEAAPPSTRYRLRKLAGRHRALLLTAAAFVAVLVLATGVSLWLALRASTAERQAVASRDRAIRSEAEAIARRDDARSAEKAAREEQARATAAERAREVERDKAVAERRRADLQATTTRAVVDFLQNDLLKVANTTAQADRGVATPTRDIKVREALDRAAASIGDRFRNQPEVEAEIRNTIGETYFNLNILPMAKEQLEAAYNLRKKSLGPLHPAALESLHGIGMVLRADGKSAQAVELFRQVVDGRQRVFGAEDRRTLQAMHSVAVALRSAGQAEQARDLHQKVLEVRQRVLGVEDPDTMRSFNDLGVAYIYSSQAEAGLPLAEQAYRLRSKVLGPEHPDTVVSMQAYAMGLFSTKQAEKSLPLLLRARELNERLRGRDHTVTLDNTGSIGNAYGALFRMEEAVRYYSLAADGYVRRYGEQHPIGMNWRMNVAGMYQDAGRFSDSVSLLKTYIPRWAEARGPNDTGVQQARYLLAKSLLWGGNPAQALEIGVPLLPMRTQARGAADVGVGLLTQVVAQAYVQTDRLQEAEAAYRTVVEARRVAKRDATGLQAALAEVLLRQGRRDEAEALVRSLLPEQEPRPGWTSSYLRGILGATLAAKGDYAGAEALLLAAHNVMSGMRGRVVAPEWYQLDQVHAWITAVYAKQGKAELAAEWASRRPR